MTRIVCWFSAGAASAVATKIALRRYDGAEIIVARIHVAEEDNDNARFAADCEAWFGVPIRVLRNQEYASCDALWRARRYMSGPKGAICTGTMKRSVRWDFEAEWAPDRQVFGFTADERQRADRMRAQEPWLGVLTPLVDAGMSKDDCFAFVQRAGLTLPLAYRQGYRNANCTGCVKAQSPGYWNRVRATHPDVFAERASLSRELGVRLVKLTSGARERVFLDELDPTLTTADSEPSWDCTIACAVAEQETAA